MMSKTRFALATVAFATLCTLSPLRAQQNAGTPPVDLPGSQINQSERYEARRASADNNQQGLTVKEAIVKKLHKANQAEIELAKMAIEKTDNDDVKQFAQTLVQDHQACQQKLKQLTNMKSATKATSPTTVGSPMVPQALCQVVDQASENALMMIKEMLSNYEGQDFNMAFLGQQSVAHTMMLAELKAIESTGPNELQSVAQEMSKKVEKHLKKAKDLAKKLEDDRSNKQSSDRS
ncbi:DUF4142 domain-containing protein [Neorhodopirellula pilleata]|uniref:DUF4142 domain-containing protein n=1 Tax=Neorhodopirellula pilleata TaxID=2714738 RepID=A0A5C5ZY86_9BACT|nr:DUF4142 domain-containing protein [Neorhodopirellula pilleata]TWT91887.1 hypothetical protein Pla100_49260 [Neorhodopirellula pilleata]